MHWTLECIQTYKVGMQRIYGQMDGGRWTMRTVFPLLDLVHF